MTHARKSMFLVCGVVFLTMTAAPPSTAASGQLAIAPAVQSLPIMGEPSASLSQRVALWLDRWTDVLRGERALRTTAPPRDRASRSLSSSQHEPRFVENPNTDPPVYSGGDEATGPWPKD